MRFLIAGYGNCYRQDDLVGLVLEPMVRQLLENQEIAVKLYLDLQLFPEKAFYLAEFDVVIFIDANAKLLEHGFCLERVAPDMTPPGANLHTLSPGSILTLIDQLELPQPAGAYPLSVSGHSLTLLKT
jgi:Ni,Fe-hydrogenase maturation factor